MIRVPQERHDDVFPDIITIVTPAEGPSKINTQITLWAFLDMQKLYLSVCSGNDEDILVPGFNVMLYEKQVATITTVRHVRERQPDVTETITSPSDNHSIEAIAPYSAEVNFTGRRMGWLPILTLLSDVLRQMLQYPSTDKISTNFSVGSVVEARDSRSGSWIRLTLTDTGPDVHPFEFKQLAKGLRCSFVDLIRGSRWESGSAKVSYDNLEFLTVEWVPPIESSPQNLGGKTAASIETE